MQGLISIPFNLRNRKMFIQIVIKIWFITQYPGCVIFAPANNIEVTVKFKPQFNTSFVLNCIAQVRLAK